ncbi:alanyl-tRNA synthetase [Methanobrevibacter gottschalkii]|uniref:Alanine--tRNA ligase n=1 Tax=Methanobrevibacter gottschalkii TaxID=190974 RepID=A0A1H7IDG0_9EURY|nr:alanine--tRNA ligase [Methanobrevibacter gottschalkii]SEK60509.1 alanyl-tRNA synthetase [Methanobrevibacter gottschalkii]
MINMVEIFEKLGYKLQTCKTCGQEFYSQVDRDTCGDAPCDEYGFIANPATDKPYNLYEIQKVFKEFLESEGHTAIDRYPVLAKRWRDDVFLVGASIFCFQPWITSGLVKPPANPLEIAQPSIRLNDVDNVGRTGRHMTCFTMGSHTVINTEDDFIYWEDETIRLCHEFFKSIGINTEEITFIKSWWSGGGNEGPCYEVCCRGVELATLVFIQYETLDDGSKKEIPIKVVDTGYGLERIAWISQGTPTAYDACFAPVVDKLMELTGVEINEDIQGKNAQIAGMMDIEDIGDLKDLRQQVADSLGISLKDYLEVAEPMEAIYIIADHTRCLAFMIADGIIPSNVKEGYLARLVLRRTIRFMKDLNMKESLADIMAIQLDFLSKFYPEIRDSEQHIMNIITLEEERYASTVKKGKSIVKRSIKRLKKEGKNEMPLDMLIDLYDAHGIPPETVVEMAGNDFIVNVPDNFFTQVAGAHEKDVSNKKSTLKVNFPETELLFYKDFYQQEFEAEVLGIIEKDGNQCLIFDKTTFYPEGGGQPSDIGEVSIEGNVLNVTHAEKVDNVVLHHVDEVSKDIVGKTISGKIDWDRRITLARHHTGTHLVIAAARKVLGQHIWQAGSQNSLTRARIDLSHYKRITQEELNEIEKLANEYVMENIDLDIQFHTRDEAQELYGFVLYQGGIVPGKMIRVVKIPGVDVQACAGTHVPRTGVVGPIKINKTERVQDGVERIDFSAGIAAIDSMQHDNELLRESSAIFKVDNNQLPKTCDRFFSEWKAQKNEIDRLKSQIASLKMNSLADDYDEINGLKVVSELMEADFKELQKIATDFTDNGKADVVIIGNTEGKIVGAASQNAIDNGIKINNVIKSAASILGGGGGGRLSLAQGAGKNTDKMDEAIQTAIGIIKG